MNNIVKTCQQCNNEFNVPKYREKTAKFCCKECYDKSQENKVTVECSYCGESITRKASTIKQNNFCNLKCLGKWNGQNNDTKITKTCTICNSEYSVKLCDSEKSVACSNACQGKWQSIYRVGENSSNWKDGISKISSYLRTCINPWVWESIKECNNKCVITGDTEDIDVHHIVSFNTILQIVFDKTRIDIRPTINDYSQDELDRLSNKCLQLHYDYGLGVCVRKDLHTLFHCQYGYGDNTKEQWELFMQTPRD